MSDDFLMEEALTYHKKGRPGKIAIEATKDTATSYDLSLAYSPGVAAPCVQINEDPEQAYTYTAKGNLVAVISNGTAVLGLGDIGALASKPVMEGKAVLFKKFADIDVFDLEINERDPKKIIDIIKSLEPTFGGINLEDIKAPECFEIETTLQEMMDIPVMHDDQHGTAIVSGAALLNALSLQGKKIEEVRFVVIGAGAAALSCIQMYQSLGARSEHITLFDSKGAVWEGRTDLNEQKRRLSLGKRAQSWAEAMQGADVFIGLSRANVLAKEMVVSMAPRPIVFAMANPDPEIPYGLAKEVRKDIIIATGRSDLPNQVNNVLGFPYIFRGALDTRAKKINEAMKLAAVRALADMAKMPVPSSVLAMCRRKHCSFGADYIIPTPFDPRLLEEVAAAVAQAAVESGVARKAITDWEDYKQSLRHRL